MKAFVASLALILSVTTVIAQQESWDMYMARYGQKPGSVLVDMGQLSTAPDILLPFLVITGPSALNCTNPQGIPSNDDINLMENILASTDNFLTGITAKKLVGTFTYNCERLNYYYVRDTTNLRNAIGRMYKISFSDYKYTIKIKPDPNWTVYRTFLYPDSAATAWIAANKMLLAMIQSGDSLKDERAISHTLYFTTDTGRNRFTDFANVHRYHVVATRNSESITLPYEVVVSRNSHVKMDSILAMESELKSAAKAYKGYYKGWDATKHIATDRKK